ncbi:macrophage receptor MARCO isoform 1-T2 [Discoglossus pictus]
MESFGKSLEDDTNSKSFIIADTRHSSGISEFEMNDIKRPVSTGRSYLLIFICVYLIVLSGGVGYLVYKDISLEQELVTIREGIHQMQSGDSASEGESLKLEVLHNYTMLPSVDRGTHKLQLLEKEVETLLAKHGEMVLMINNITLLPGPPGMDGIKGEPGIPGKDGKNGELGRKGEPGVPGSSASKGEKGDTGPHGQKGEEGKQGMIGPKGSTGFTGIPGPAGSSGTNGTKGEPGLPGLAGSKGDSGAKGSPGLSGLPGQKGSKGDPGLIGKSGLDGLPGVPGTKGNKGDAGIIGLPGVKGNPGAPGLNGPPGAKGETGLQGQKGNPGEKGSTGAQGPPGPTGSKGDSAGGIVRLAGGGNKGRVEISYGGSWGTICDDNWDLNDGKVICKMLGYSQAVAVYTPGGGTGKILLDDVACVGTELSILDCPKSNWEVHNCNHGEDAGVECAA